MKHLCVIFFMALSSICFSQKADPITVSFQKQAVTASLSEDNTNNKITLPFNLKPADQLSIIYSNGQEEKQWKRSFEIFDSTERSLFKMQPSSYSLYRISGKQLKPLLKKGQNYSLYTMAIPADEKLAATVRVRRIFVCWINVK